MGLLLLASCNQDCKECKEYKDCAAKLDSASASSKQFEKADRAVNLSDIQEDIAKEFDGYSVTAFKGLTELPVNRTIETIDGWMTDYKRYLKRDTYTIDNSYEVNYVKFDEIPFDEQLRFLRRTQPAMVPQLMSKIFEDAHLAKLTPITNPPVEPANCAYMPWSTFRSRVTHLLPQGITFESCQFDQFINLACNGGTGENGVTITYGNYNKKNNNYSVPALYALQRNNNIPDNARVYFHETDQGHFLIIVPTANNSYNAFYNFSGILP